jgi:hypothetical protein
MPALCEMEYGHIMVGEYWWPLASPALTQAGEWLFGRSLYTS